MSRALSCANYIPIPCDTACAFDQIREMRYAAMVLDWDLKRSLSREILAEAKSRGLPVVVMCSSLPQALQAGGPYADVYLEKPVNTQELCAMIVAVAAVTPHASSQEQTVARSATAA